MKRKLQHQKDLNGCGIACLANLLDKSYDWVKKDFENKFYTTKRGVKIFDIINYLETHNLKYRSKFFNRNRKNKADKDEAEKFSKIENSITLIVKSEKYALGHYLLRTKNGWIDPWYDFPSVHKVRAGVRKKLLDDPWYVIYPVSKKK